MLASAYNIINEQVKSATGQLVGATFSYTQSLLFNGVAYTIIGLIVMFWLLQRLKDNFPKDQLWKAFVWICITAFIFGIFSSKAAYNEFVGWLEIPFLYVNEICSSVSGGGGIASKFGKIYNTMVQYKQQMYEYVTTTPSLKKEWGDSSIPFISAVMNTIRDVTFNIYIFPYYIVWLFIIIMLIACAAMILVTTLTSGILLAIAPIVIPLIIIPQTRQYFFSWLKLYISIKMYQPLALLLLGLATQSINLLTKNEAKTIWENTMSNCFPSICMCLIAIYTVQKIPNWVQSIMGASDGGGGASAAGAMMSPVGKAGALATGGALAAAGAGGKGLGNGLSKIGDALSKKGTVGKLAGSAFHAAGSATRKASGGNAFRKNADGTFQNKGAEWMAKKFSKGHRDNVDFNKAMENFQQMFNPKPQGGA